MKKRTADETPAERERRLEKKRAYREKRRAELAAKQREYYARNREKQLAYHKQYQKRHRKRLTEYLRAYHVANKDRLREKAEQRRQKNKDAIQRRSRAYYESHKEEARIAGILRYCRKNYASQIRGMSDQQIVGWHRARMASRQEQRDLAKAEKEQQRAERHKHRERRQREREIQRQAAEERRTERIRLRQLRADGNAVSEEERGDLVRVSLLRAKAKEERRLGRASESEERNAYWQQLHRRFIDERGWPQVELSQLSVANRKTLSLHWRREKRKRVEAHILSHGTDEEKALVRKELDARKAKTKEAKKRAYELHKEANSAKRKQKYQRDRELILEKMRLDRVRNPERGRRQRKARYERKKEEILRKNREYMAQRKQQDPEYRELLNQRLRERRKKDGGKTTRREREWRRHKRNTDVQFKLQVNLRKRLYMAVKKNAKSGSAVRMLGCSIEFLKMHLESQFDDRMSWGNWSLDGWHIDHIYPLSSADLRDPIECAAALNWQNLRPVWGKENTSKGGRVTREAESLFNRLKAEVAAKQESNGSAGPVGA
jgi:hypothetical protein